MDEKHFSIDREPALGGGGYKADPAERRAAPTDRPPREMEALRDSVANEPALPEHADPQQWTQWLSRKRLQCSLPGSLGVTLLAAVLGGPFAIVGALMAGRQGTLSGFVYAVVFGPVIEELLKQSGMTYLLEKKPYRVFATWQFPIAAVISGLTFGVIENLVYIHVYASAGGVKDLAALATFRWTVCTPLHVVCASIASMGLVRVWRRQLRDARPADLSAAFPYFAVAMVVHGAYNFGVMFLDF